jgi:hypothetical protein
MIAIAESNGFKTIEVPITEIYTEDGSTLNPWRHGFLYKSKINLVILNGV